jgi:hypothetical protein
LDLGCEAGQALGLQKINKGGGDQGSAIHQTMAEILEHDQVEIGQVKHPKKGVVAQPPISPALESPYLALEPRSGQTSSPESSAMPP